MRQAEKHKAGIWICYLMNRLIYHVNFNLRSPLFTAYILSYFYFILVLLPTSCRISILDLFNCRDNKRNSNNLSRFTSPVVARDAICVISFALHIFDTTQQYQYVTLLVTDCDTNEWNNFVYQKCLILELVDFLTCLLESLGTKIILKIVRLLFFVRLKFVCFHVSRYIKAVTNVINLYLSNIRFASNWKQNAN